MNNMTPEQHAELISEQTRAETHAKYLAGAKKYGTKLWEYPVGSLIDNAIEESLDEGTYLRTARQQMTELKSLVIKLFALLNDPIEEPIDDETADLIEQISLILGLS